MTKTTQLIVRGGRVIDPASGVDAVLDVRVVDGRVAELGAELSNGTAEIVDAAGTRGVAWIHRPACPPARARPGAQGDYRVGRSSGGSGRFHDHLRDAEHAARDGYAGDD